MHLYGTYSRFFSASYVYQKQWDPFALLVGTGCYQEEARIIHIKLQTFVSVNIMLLRREKSLKIIRIWSCKCRNSIKCLYNVLD